MLCWHLATDHKHLNHYVHNKEIDSCSTLSVMCANGIISAQHTVIEGSITYSTGPGRGHYPTYCDRRFYQV